MTTAPAETAAPSGTLFRLATAGSVDDGKSTLVGRLLHDAQAILSDQLAAVARTSAERGFGEAFDADDQPLDLALLTDGLRSEREQGITIDVAYRYFATDKRSFVLADCPGHVQYTRNTVTGTSTADAVVLLVDVRNGVVEQTRRHLAVATLLRVEHIIVAVNKIDAVDYSEAAFRAVEEDIQRVARELWAQNSGDAAVTAPIVVPVSALRGDNVVNVSERTRWYSGEALLPILEQLPDADAEHRRQEPLRLPVQTVIRPQGGLAPDADPDSFTDFRGYAGQIAAGTLRPGDRVRIQPGHHTAEVTAVRRTDLQRDLVPGEAALAGESVVVELSENYDVARGSLLSAVESAAQERDELTVRLAWLHEKPLTPGARVLFKHGTATVKALVTEISDRLDLTTLTAQPAAQLNLNDIGTATVKLAAALPVDDYAASKRTGASLLIDPADGNTLAAGLISLPQATDDAETETDEDWLSS
ncbi:sulfate adenylyltransferase subunit 1 [Nesterenkonia alba]|uniref:sulfate adenylyltransferase subunit 1 n=1 Tax=Nesterenkonia alba TaxID=515814 RepID=UPI0003B68BC5|nr:GTP-binding protein [Nesterenkonia alba]